MTQRQFATLSLVAFGLLFVLLITAGVLSYKRDRTAPTLDDCQPTNYYVREHMPRGLRQVYVCPDRSQ